MADLHVCVASQNVSKASINLFRSLKRLGRYFLRQSLEKGGNVKNKDMANNRIVILAAAKT